MRFGEYRFFSLILDAPAVRLSIWDANGQEFFAIVEEPARPGYRKLRRNTLDLIADAIEDGREPGEVHASLQAPDGQSDPRERLGRRPPTAWDQDL
jgi:hypothetical protein